MRVASIQLEIGERSKQSRVERVLELLRSAKDAELILLPEIWPTGYFGFSRYEAEAETMDGPVVAAIRQIAAPARKYIFMGSMVEREGERLYNTSLLIDSAGGIAARYRKIHLFGYQSEERRLLTRGEDVVVAETPWGRMGLSTCYDLRFPELYRRQIDLGAECFLVCAAWPAARVEGWKLFSRSRAHENLAWLLSCNCGGEPFAGHSAFVSPLGEVVAEAKSEEEILTADVNVALARKVRGEFSALEDRVFC